MDYYDSGFYGREIGKYHCSKTSYDIVPYQACSDFDFHTHHYLTATASYGVYSYSEFDEPTTFLDPYPAYNCDAFSDSEMNYSRYNFSEPKLITYDPTPRDNGYVVSRTQYLISYSTTDSEFNEPLFEDYDPTPYGGGYDLTLTYGKPLPPCDKICYPRSTPDPNDVLPSQNISNGTIPLKSPKNGDAESETLDDNQSKKVDVGVGVSEIPPPPSTRIVKTDGGENGQGGGALSCIGKESRDEDRAEEYTYSDHGYEYEYDYPWSSYEYGNGKQVVPYEEYNSDTVELCESIFGHWPCLAKARKQQGSNEDVAKGERNCNPWEGAAAVYIFGDPWGF